MFMPKGAEELKVLHERAARLASRPVDLSQAEQGDSYILFQLGVNDHYGIPYRFAKEVMTGSQLSPVPHAPRYVDGVVNWRGKLISVINLKKLLLNQFTDQDDFQNQQIIIIQFQEVWLGLLVYAIEGSQSFHQSQLQESLNLLGAIESKHILGLHQGTVAIINIPSIINDLHTKGEDHERPKSLQYS